MGMVGCPKTRKKKKRRKRVEELLKKLDSRISSIREERESREKREMEALSLLETLMKRAREERVTITLSPLPLKDGESEPSSFDIQPLVISGGLIVRRGEGGKETLLGLADLKDPRKGVLEKILPILCLALEGKVEVRVEEGG